MDAKRKQEENEIEYAIGRILRVGVLIAAGVIIIGLIMLVAMNTTGYPAGVHPTEPGAILAGVMAGKPYAVLMFGLFLLILTPVLRVIVSIYAFVKEKDWLYTWITALVLLILTAAMIIGYFE